MPNAQCPMPNAQCPVVPHLSEKGYTSKTVSWTGEIVQNLGGARTIKSAATLVEDGAGFKRCSWDFPSGIG